MDFTNRNQQTSGRPGMAFSAGADEPAPEHKPKPVHSSGSSAGRGKSKWFLWGGGVLVIIVAVLIAAALALFIMAKPDDEGNLVNSSKLQAVFLTNDQVYFGNITSVNSKYMVLQHIYYLQSSSTSSKATNSNVSLVKLGCELHKPQDQMVISQDQVSFWENLQSDGQVAKAVAQYEKANPNGQTCSNTNPSSNPVQGTSDTSTTPTSTPSSANTKQ